MAFSSCVGFGQPTAQITVVRLLSRGEPIARELGLRKERSWSPQNLADLASKLTEEAKRLCIDNRLKRRFTTTSELGPHEGAEFNLWGKVRHPRGLIRALALPGSPRRGSGLSPSKDHDGIPDKCGDPRVEVQPSAFIKEHRQNVLSNLVGARKHPRMSGELTRGLARLCELAGPGKLRKAQQETTAVAACT